MSVDSLTSIDRSDEHSEKAHCPMYVIDFIPATVVSDEQPRNVSPSIVVILGESVTFWSPLQYAKAKFPSFSNEYGSLISSIFGHFLKVFHPISTRDEGSSNTTSLKLEHPQKAYSPMWVTFPVMTIRWSPLWSLNASNGTVRREKDVVTYWTSGGTTSYYSVPWYS